MENRLHFPPSGSPNSINSPNSPQQSRPKRMWNTPGVVLKGHVVISALILIVGVAVLVITGCLPLTAGSKDITQCSDNDGGSKTCEGATMELIVIASVLAGSGVSLILVHTVGVLALTCLNNCLMVLHIVGCGLFCFFGGLSTAYLWLTVVLLRKYAKEDGGAVWEEVQSFVYLVAAATVLITIAHIITTIFTCVGCVSMSKMRQTREQEFSTVAGEVYTPLTDGPSKGDAIPPYGNLPL